MNIQRGWSLIGGDLGARRLDERRGHMVLVGECPALGQAAQPANILCGPTFCGSAGKPGKLAMIAGMNFREFLGFFDRVNVYEQPPPHRAPAKSQANQILNEVAEGRDLVLLGRRVADAFKIPRGTSFLQSLEIASDAGPVTVHLVPHPSASNHWWRDRRNQQAAAKFLRSIMRSALD